MKKNLLKCLCLPLGMLCVVLSACSDDNTEPTKKTEYTVTEFASTTIPETIPAEGGAYTMTFTTRTETRSQPVVPVFEPWQYRVTLGEAVGDAIAVTEPKTEVSVVIGSNYSKEPRAVVVEMAVTEDAAPPPRWIRIVEAEQEPALKDYCVTEYDSTTIPETVPYNGGGYKLGFTTSIETRAADPIFVEWQYRVTLGDKVGDPVAVTERTESIDVEIAGNYTENERNIVVEMADAGAEPQWTKIVEARQEAALVLTAGFYWAKGNVTLMDGKFAVADKMSDLGLYFRQGSKYGVPSDGGSYAGTAYTPLASGQISGKSQFGGYWGLGANYAGEGVIYVLNADYSMVDYDLAGTNMASLRCVKNIRQPSYVSHTPASVTDNASFKLTVKTDPGEFPAYEVDIEAEDGEIRSIDASPSETEVTLTVPKNDEVGNREWRLFINRVYSGISFVQPGKKNYVDYISHSPSKATYEAFTLSVKCESDLASFPVVIKGSDGLELTQNGSKENPTVSFSVPENAGEERTLAIWVNGSDTGKSVRQEANPATNAFSVTWSEGYLTVVDGAYTFAEPKERGMYFKWKSKYGIKFEGTVSSSTKYQGVVYGPDEQSIPNYADVPYGDVDPCSLVAPAGTWRMPTSEQLLELVADGAKEFEPYAFRMCSDGMQEVYLASAGQLANDGLSVKSANIISVWTPDASETKPGQYSYLMWLMSTESSKGSVSANGVLPQTAMMVRCVRSK